MPDPDYDLDDNAPEDAGVKKTLRLCEYRVNDAGAALGLRAGDVLAAINGKAFIGSSKELTERFIQANGKPLALTFLRGDIDITVLADHPNLGKWEAVPARPWNEARQDPASMRNWEVLRTDDGRYDLHPLTPGPLVLLVPPIWLLQNRLWVPAAAIVAAIAISAAIWWPIGALVYVLTGMILRRSGATLYRLDRVNMGMIPYAIVAAHSEAGAHAAYGKIDPKGRFYFGGASKDDTKPPADQTAPDTTA